MLSQTPQAELTTSPQARTALIAGAIAGPLYVCVGILEAVFRQGFDIRIHSLSLLANGTAGWIHQTMMVVSGLLTVIGALAVGSVQQRSGRRSYAMVTGLVVYGLGIAAAGLLPSDPAEGFPIGTPPGPPAVVSASGVGHLVAGGIGFLGLIVACLVCARRAARAGQRTWAAVSAVIGVYYLVAFAGIASGVGNPAINIAFTVAVALGWAWFTALCVRSLGNA
jgi:MFS family permease